LLQPQSPQRSDFRRAPRRQVARDERRRHQHEDRAGERWGVDRSDAKELRSNQPRCRQSRRDADGDSRDGNAHRFAEHHSRHVARLGAERRAQSELARALARRVRRDSVEPERGEHQRDDAEEHRDLDEQDILRHGAPHQVVHRSDADRQRGIDLFDRATNRLHEAGWITANVHRQLGLPRFAHVRIVEHDVHLATGLAADVAALKIAHDADDGVRDAVDAHRGAEWVAGAEIARGHGLVDHSSTPGGRARLEIAWFDVAAPNQVRADCVEVVRAHAVE
jgi:hypothetical protein